MIKMNYSSVYGASLNLEKMCSVISRTVNGGFIILRLMKTHDFCVTENHRKVIMTCIENEFEKKKSDQRLKDL